MARTGVKIPAAALGSLLANVGAWVIMPKRSSKKNRPRDPNELAKSIVDEATAGNHAATQNEPPQDDDGKNPAAVALGRLGGKKGGKARAAKLTLKARSEIAREAAAARWANRNRRP